MEKSAKYSVMQNAYASLVELDYMMHYGVKNIRQEPIKFNFGPDTHQQIEQCNRPFEEVYYIDKITSLPAPDTVEFAYNQLKRIQENTANALFISATNIISTYTGTIDNVRQKIMEGQFNVGDKFAWVSGLGMAELYFDPQSASSPKVIKAAIAALKARLVKESLQADDKSKIANRFTKDHWDESKGPYDGNPLIGLFPTEKELRDNSFDFCKDHQNHSYREDVSLEKVMLKLKRQSPDEIVNYQIKDYCDELNKLIESLIDSKSYEEISLEGSQGLGISLHDIYDIVDRIQKTNKSSLNQIQKIEQEGHNNKQKELDAIIEKTRTDYEEKIKNQQTSSQQQANTNIWTTLRDFFGNKSNTVNNVGQSKGTDETYNTKLALDKAEAATYWLLACIDGKVIEILNGLITYTDQKLNEIKNWIDTLEKANEQQPELPKEDTKGKINYDETEKEENRVEAQIINPKNYKLLYKQIVELDSDYRTGIKLNGENALFESLARSISQASGKDLQEYLVIGIEDMNKTKNDFYNKNDRTDLQKVIDRLIDLSTPTMQVDRHGYGNRVNPDEFWYIMTDCGEDSLAKDETERKMLKKDSVGGLLQKLIEGNTLDESVNLVHVSGWTNKAILYRVKAAVPPYFVEGVCTSDCGGITLESCYEELKLTKPTYTPFSHEILRQKLEAARTVLKPHDSMDKDEALNHWVRFMIKGYITLEHEKNTNNDPKTNARGTYSIQSDTFGEFKVGKILGEKKILILGETSRYDAFNMFARYCATLINERPNYLEEINPIENPNYCETFDITRQEYMNNCIEGYGIKQSTMERYPEDDEDKKLIRRELELFIES